MAGPHKGNEFVLDGDEMVVGRASDNAVAIPDTSVSRKHVLLRKTETGWAASDMGSGNGTLVNGAAIAEETPLNVGDVITLGDTELKYVAEGGSGAGRAVVRRSGDPASGARARPVVRRARSEDPEASAKKKKNLIRFGAVVVVLLAGGIGYKLISDKKRAAVASQQQAENRTLEELRTLMQEGKNLVRAGKWGEAKAKFEEVQTANADFNAGSVKDYLTKCEQEIPNQQRLDEAEAAVKAGEITKAFKLLAQVTKDTAQIPRREEVRGALDKKIEARMIDEAAPLLPEVKDKAKMQQLLALANDVLGARAENRDALHAKETAEKAIYAIEHPYEAPKEAPKPWLDVQARYQSGDQSGALALAEACAGKAPQCKALSQQIHDFADKYKKLESANANELVAMLELDRKIAGGQASPMSKNVGVRVVGEYYKKASAAKAKNEWGAAIAAAKNVLLADPGHAGAQNILSEGKGKAKDIYLQGYQAKDGDPDQAKVLFKQVLQMTTKDDEYYGKAQAQLEKLK